MTSQHKSFLALYLSLTPDQQEQLHALAIQMKSLTARTRGRKESAFQVHFGNPRGLFLVEEELSPAVEAFDAFRQPAGPAMP